jgi:uncharacterized protein (DUF1800 family)
MSKPLNHLYQRAGFGLSPQQWMLRHSWTREKALQELFEGQSSSPDLPLPESPLAIERAKGMDKEKLDKAKMQERQFLLQQNADWIRRMADPQAPDLLERMSLFWHGHFACRITIAKLATQQLNSIRQHALGHFRDLVLAIAKDPAMIRYLNNQQNTKAQPNENFARELMELFTLGRGHYSEQDIREAARAFTGWSSNTWGAFVFKSWKHDSGSKTFMGKTGAFDGEDIIDIILEKKETAIFITNKIYRYFVNEQVDTNKVLALADHFYYSNYNIKSLMWEIFSSDWFYASENQGAKIKSPVELMAGIIRQLGVEGLNAGHFLAIQRTLGQQLFSPPNVAGWPGGKSWIDNSTLMTRLQLPMALYKAQQATPTFKDKPKGRNLRQLKNLEAAINWEPLYQLTEGKNEEEMFDALSTFFLSTPLAVDKNAILNLVSRKSKEAFVQELCISLMGLPEYQLC